MYGHERAYSIFLGIQPDFLTHQNDRAVATTVEITRSAMYQPRSSGVMANAELPKIVASGIGDKDSSAQNG